MNKIINFCYLYPHPNLPPRGKEQKAKLTPLGETGKGVKNNKSKLIDY
jgi:hypothetical protein